MEMEKQNLRLPKPLTEALRAVWEANGWERKQWKLYTAALLDFIRLGDAEVRRRVGEVSRAEATGELSAIIADAFAMMAERNLAAETGTDGTRPPPVADDAAGAPPRPRRTRSPRREGKAESDR